MKNYEQHELIAQAYRVLEGTELEWWECIQIRSSLHDEWKQIKENPRLNLQKSQYRVADMILEGRPLFKGDKVYCIDCPCTFISADHGVIVLENSSGIRFKMGREFISWNAPKPKTVMVELTVEDAEHYAQHHYNTIGDACRKALEKLK